MIKLIDIFNEIKVNNPVIKFPLYLKNEDEWKRVAPILKIKGYSLLGHKENQEITSAKFYWGEKGIEIFPLEDNKFRLTYNNVK